MYEVTVSTADELIIEIDARLAAMATFLDDLRDDPAARSLLMGMAEHLQHIAASGLDTVDTPEDVRPLCDALTALHRIIRGLPETTAADGHDWTRLRTGHQQCRDALSKVAEHLANRRVSQRINAPRAVHSIA